MEPGETPAATSLLSPVAGVSIEHYATIVRAVAVYDYDPAMFTLVAAQHGVGEHDWRRAHREWGDRIRSDPAVARWFTDVYHSGR